MTSVVSPNVQIMATPVPFSGSASSWATIGTDTPKSGVVACWPKSGWKRSSSGWATTATHAGSSSGRVVSISSGAPSGPVKTSLWYAPGSSLSVSSACATDVFMSTSHSVGDSAR